MSKACARMTAMRGLEAGPPQVLPRNLTASPKTQKASVFLLVQFSPDAALILTLVGGGGNASNLSAGFLLCISNHTLAPAPITAAKNMR